MHVFQFIVQDWEVNRGNPKGRIILVLFRLANLCSKRKYMRYVGLPYLLFYRFFVEWILSVEIPWNLRVGKNLTLFHGQCLVINKLAIIGDNCTLRHGTTIGNKMNPDGSYSEAPRLGNHVDVGSNACIIGGIELGDHVKVGCGAVVVRSASPGSVLVGNPAVDKRMDINRLHFMEVQDAEV